MIRLGSLSIAGLYFIAAIGCRSPGSAVVSHEGFVVLPGARAVTTDKSFDGRLTYRVAAQTADEPIRMIRARLESSGWKLQRADPMNADVQDTARWREVEYGHEWVMLWSEAWRDSRGEIVWYRYTHHVHSSGELEVQATHFRKERVEQIKEDLKGFTS